MKEVQTVSPGYSYGKTLNPILLTRLSMWVVTTEIKKKQMTKQYWKAPGKLATN